MIKQNKLKGYTNFLFHLDCILTQIKYIEKVSNTKDQKFLISDLKYLKSLLKRYLN